MENREQIIRAIQEAVPPFTAEPSDPAVLKKLVSLTADLIAVYEKDASLWEEWASEAMNRQIPLLEQELVPILKGKTVLVTGGKGCIGSQLILKLKELPVGRIVSVDRNHTSDETAAGAGGKTVCYTQDLRDAAGLSRIFAKEKPAIVFHLGAIRLPWLAEMNVRETVQTNCLATRQVIRCCEENGVERCIYSSSGKASKYYTGEVYAATKKMVEWLFTAAAETGRTRYQMVRFTHIINNSWVCTQYDEKIQKGAPVNVHAPDRFVIVQNSREAVALLLNAAIQARPGRCSFSVIRRLGWPVETLWMALHKIVDSGKKLPIYFEGVPAGYQEHFFRGQFDWGSAEVNTLINALETPDSAIHPSGSMIVSRIIPFSKETLSAGMERLERLLEDESVPDPEIKKALAVTVREIALSSLRQAPPERLLTVLKWGLIHNEPEPEGEHEEILALFAEGLEGRVKPAHAERAELSQAEFIFITKKLSEAFSAHLKA